MSEEKKEKIPVSGNLGILAYGDVGIEEWRKVKREYRKNHPRKAKKEEE